MLFSLPEFAGEEVCPHEEQAQHEVRVDPSLLPKLLEREAEHVHQFSDEA